MRILAALIVAVLSIVVAVWLMIDREEKHKRIESRFWPATYNYVIDTSKVKAWASVAQDIQLPDMPPSDLSQLWIPKRMVQADQMNILLDWISHDKFLRDRLPRADTALADYLMTEITLYHCMTENDTVIIGKFDDRNRAYVQKHRKRILEICSGVSRDWCEE